jgi:putative membrane protein insertion efficiency factor
MSYCAVNRAAISLVLFFSGFFRILGGRACRFYPSCSAYSIEAFRRFGFFKALWLTISRILKCHPFHAGGYNPLPQERHSESAMSS